MKVFISSTYEDLAEYRIAVRDFLKSLEHEPLMLPSPVDDDIPDYKKLIDETEVFIGIYAHRYGDSVFDDANGMKTHLTGRLVAV